MQMATINCVHKQLYNKYKQLRMQKTSASSNNIEGILIKNTWVMKG